MSYTWTEYDIEELQKRYESIPVLPRSELALSVVEPVAPVKAIKCECGSEVVYGKDTNLHSDYCPKYRKYK